MWIETRTRTLIRTVAMASMAALLVTGAALAQTTPATPGTSAPPASGTPAAGTHATPTPPAGTSPKSMAGSASASAKPAAGSKVNLNTANATQLDALPGVGSTRAKAILTERAKGPFKDWSDFDTRTAHSSINAGVKAKIKDLVTF